MIYSPHTLELTLTPNTEKFHKLKDKAYKNSKGNHRMHLDKKRLGVHKDSALANEGIKIEYHDGTYKKKVKLIVNPTRLLGGDDVEKLWKPNNDNILKLLCLLEKHIEDYFGGKYGLDDFELTRIDFTANIDVDSNKNVAAYIKVLHSIGKVKGFAPKYEDDNDWIDKNLSFDLEGNSNGVEFTAYDKEAESKRKEAKGILRVEIRLTKPKAIRKCTNETSASEQIKSLSLSSRNIFLVTFVRIVPYGDYYKKPIAMKIIEENIPKKKSREKMLSLLELIPKKKSLYLAQKEMHDRNIDQIMTMFEQLNVSPVTISKRHEIKHLKSLYFYLSN